MGSFGSTELLIVVAIVVLLFGGSKIPQLMRGVGEGMREFRRGLDEGKKSE
jgi:sec-independent protein translocase protein TatA